MTAAPRPAPTWRRIRDGIVLRGAEVLEGEEVLPGFSLALEELFEWQAGVPGGPGVRT